MTLENYRLNVNISGEKHKTHTDNLQRVSRESVVNSISSSNYSDFVRLELTKIVRNYPDNALNMFMKNRSQIIYVLQQKEQKRNELL